MTHAKRLYDSTGYLSFDTLYSYNTFLTFVIGARGIGKTYNALRYSIEHKINTIYVRRTQEEADIASGKESNVLSEIIETYHIPFERLKDTKIPIYRIYDKEYAPEEENKTYCDICFASLTAFNKIRSIGLHKYDVIIYDEFIPEKIVRKMKHEGDAFHNMIETVNRNRELNGKPSIKIFALSNSNDIYNDILAHYDLISTLVKMQANKQEVNIDRKRSIGLIYPMHSPISERKKDTALYKALGDSEYTEMALSNKFSNNIDYPFIRSQNLKEYKPVIKVGELTVYEHKHEWKYYITWHYSGNVRKLEVNKENMTWFNKTSTGKGITLTHLIGDCYFENTKAYVLWKAYAQV